MKEIKKILTRILYPYYYIERKYVMYIIHNFLKKYNYIKYVHIYIDEYYPFWIRQYDELDKTIYCDSYIKPFISITYTCNENIINNVIIIFEILKYKLRHCNYELDYLRLQ